MMAATTLGDAWKPCRGPYSEKWAQVLLIGISRGRVSTPRPAPTIRCTCDYRPSLLIGRVNVVSSVRTCMGREERRREERSKAQKAPAIYPNASGARCSLQDTQTNVSELIRMFVHFPFFPPLFSAKWPFLVRPGGPSHVLKKQKKTMRGLWWS